MLQIGVRVVCVCVFLCVVTERERERESIWEAKTMMPRGVAYLWVSLGEIKRQ